MSHTSTNPAVGGRGAQEFGIGVDKLVSNPKSPSIQAQSPRDLVSAAVARSQAKTGMAAAMRTAIERGAR